MLWHINLTFLLGDCIFGWLSDWRLRVLRKLGAAQRWLQSCAVRVQGTIVCNSCWCCLFFNYILLQPVTEADSDQVPIDVLYLGFSWKKVVLVSVPPNILSQFLACYHPAFSKYSLPAPFYSHIVMSISLQRKLLLYWLQLFLIVSLHVTAFYHCFFSTIAGFARAFWWRTVRVLPHSAESESRCTKHTL